MLSRNKALMGKRIYNGVSQSPNRGPVSGKGASGYLQRELRKGRMSANTVGRDGKSDSRSGVAANSLRKTKGPGFQNEGRPVVGSGGRQPFQNEGRPIVGAQGAQEPAQPAQPQITINDQGLLELPYNQEFASEQMGLVGEANEQLMGLNAEAQQQQMEYTTGKRDTQLAYDQLRRQTLNANAAGGTAFSSRYGTAVAQNANQFANQMGGLEQANTLFGQQQAVQRGAIQTNLQQQLAALAQQYANDLGAEAGNLGFGTGENETKQQGGKNGPRGYHGFHRDEGRNKKTNRKDRRNGAKGSIKKQVKR